VRHDILDDLSKLELDVMDTVWSLGECSTADVIGAYQSKRTLADTTIKTVLSNIRKKGYIELVPTTERGYRFRATVSRDSVAGRSLRQVVSKLFGGSPRQAILHLLNEERISKDDMREIQRMLDEHKQGGRKR